MLLSSNNVKPYTDFKEVRAVEDATLTEINIGYQVSLAWAQLDVLLESENHSPCVKLCLKVVDNNPCLMREVCLA